VSDQAGWTFLPDFATGELRDFLFREFASAYVPYFAFGDRGDRFYIPDVSILATPANIFDGKHAAIVGAPFEMTEGLDWTETGAQSKLVFGFELARDRRCPPASDRRTWKRIAELYGMDDAAEGGAGIAGEPSGEKKSARARRVDGAKQYQGLAAFTLMVTFWGAKSATIPNR